MFITVKKIMLMRSNLALPSPSGRIGHRTGILFEDRSERCKDRRPSILRSLQAPIPRPGGTRRAISWELPKCGRGQRDRLLWVCPRLCEGVRKAFVFWRGSRGNRYRFFLSVFIKKSKINYVSSHPPDTKSCFQNRIFSISVYNTPDQALRKCLDYSETPSVFCYLAFLLCGCRSNPWSAGQEGKME